MSTKIDRLLQSYLDALAHDDFATVAKSLLLPSAIYTNERLMMFKNEQQFIDVLSSFRKSLISLGWQRSTYQITAQSIENVGKMSAWVEWKHHSEDGDIINSTNVRLFYSIDEGETIRVQIIEILSTRSPDLFDSLTLIPLSNYQGSGSPE